MAKNYLVNRQEMIFTGCVICEKKVVLSDGCDWNDTKAQKFYINNAQTFITNLKI